MLNKIVAKLNGHGTEAESLNAALTQLGRERDAARVELDDLNKQRHQALLDDAADAVLNKIERAIDRKTVLIEKLNLADQPLRVRIDAAQRAAAQKLRKENQLEFLGVFEPIAQDVIQLQLRATELVAHSNRLGVASDREVAEAIAVVQFLSGWLKERNIAQIAMLLRRHLNPQVSVLAVAPIAPPAVMPRTRLPHERAKITDSQGAVRLGIPSVRTEFSATRISDDAEPLADGEVRAVVIRSGYPGANGAPCRAGQKIRLPRDLAKKALVSGNVEIVEEHAP